MRRFFFVLPVIFLLGGCASVAVKKVETGNEEGIRFYRPHPYLLVTEEPPPKTDAETGSAAADKPKPKKAKLSSDTQSAPAADTGKWYAQIIWLPDKSENYAIQVKSGLGTIDSSVTLKDGWELTQFGGKIDTKVPETITAISGLLQAAAGVVPKGAAGRPGPAEKVAFKLYRLEFDKSGMVTSIVGPIDITPVLH
jgi:hypothetical protein